MDLPDHQQAEDQQSGTEVVERQAVATGERGHHSDAEDRDRARSRDADDAAGAAREVAAVEEGEPDRFGQAERDHGEVDPTQA